MSEVAGPVGALAVTTTAGTGEPVVLIHPINSDRGVWEPVTALLDSPTVALDLRGHGGSVSHGPYTVDGYVRDVLAVLDDRALASAHLAGGSLGGSIALALAAQHPERARSVTTFGSTLGTGLAPEAIEAMVTQLRELGTEAYFAQLVPQVVGPAYRAEPRVLDAMRRAAAGRDETVVAEVLRGAFSADIRHLAGRVGVPVAAVGGTEDPTCPPAMTTEIAEATGGRVTLLDGVGHLPMLETPQRVAELIREQVLA
jgi:pimeloyl-ACP methyl ester carboxylesterase